VTEKSTEFSEICGACGVEVIAFVGTPHMHMLILTQAADSPPRPNIVDERICTDCAFDLIKFKLEVLAHKHDSVSTVSKPE
jgi:hypothetical protein